MAQTESNLKIGLALGSGSARGWSHIGVIRELTKLGIVPDIVCGTSVGALVGASYITNNLGRLEDWANSLTKFDAIKFFDINFSLSGFVNIKKFHQFLNDYIGDDNTLISDYQKQFATVSTELYSGKEVWMTKGSIIEAVWASMSMPSLFPAIQNDNTWLVDGGLVNPVPVSVCRALGADIVIAVNLNSDLISRHRKLEQEIVQPDESVTGKLSSLVKEYSGSLFFNHTTEDQPPGVLDAITKSINITQDRLTRSRLAGDPADIVLTPKLADIGLLEIHRANESIAEGKKCVRRKKAELNYIFEVT